MARGSYPEVVSVAAKNDGDGVHATSSTDSASRLLCIYRMLVVACTELSVLGYSVTATDDSSS